MLVDAGGTPCALDALCVRGVEASAGTEGLKDLSQLLGGASEPGAGLVVSLDVPAGMALRVRQVHGVVDVGGARAHLLPAGVSPRLSRMARGALELEGKLFLDVDLLALDGELPAADPPAGPMQPAGAPEGRALVFRVGAQAWTVALSAVTQVVQPQGMCPTPGRSAALVSHAGALWPVYALGERLGTGGTVVLGEHAGRPFGLIADEVLGIFEQLEPAGQRGSWSAPGATWTASGLDLALLFA